MYNKQIWKIVKPLFSDKTLVQDETVTTQDEKKKREAIKYFLLKCGKK